jgi:hypothetical protein
MSISTTFRTAAVLAGVLLFAASHPVKAAGFRFEAEYESERDRRTHERSHAVTLKPGWEFAHDRFINLVELLIEREQAAHRDAEGSRERETKFFLRLRHSGNLAQSLSYYVRGGVGRNLGTERDFTYAYVEPGLNYELTDRWEWKLAVRHIDAIDGTDGERVRKFITGPSFNLGRQNEIELQYSRARGDKDLWSWSIGYLQRF